MEETVHLSLSLEETVHLSLSLEETVHLSLSLEETVHLSLSLEDVSMTAAKYSQDVPIRRYISLSGCVTANIYLFRKFFTANKSVKRELSCSTAYHGGREHKVFCVFMFYT